MSNSVKKIYLGDYVDFQNGYAFKSSDYTDKGHYLIRIKNVQQGFIEINDECFVNVPNEAKFEKFKLKNGDIVVSLTGNVGRIARIRDVHIPAVLNQRVASVAPKSEKVLSPEYLYYLLRTPEFLEFAIGSGKGAAQQNISTSDMEKYQVSIPSLEKQAEIVEKLDNVFAEIELAKTEAFRTIQNLSDLSDSKLDEVFTMMEAEYGMIQSGKIIDVRDGTHDSPSYFDSGYPLITSKNLQDGLLDFTKVSFITEEDYQKINRRSKVDVGDLLFAMIGTIGNPVVVMENPLFAIKNVALFKANPNYDMTFLSYFLRTPRIREKFEREAKGTTQRFLGLGYLRTLDIPNVPIKDQLEAVKKLNQFKNELKILELNLAQKLENFSELNNSIMSSIFTVNSEEGAVA